MTITVRRTYEPTKDIMQDYYANEATARMVFHMYEANQEDTWIIEYLEDGNVTKTVRGSHKACTKCTHRTASHNDDGSCRECA